MTRSPPANDEKTSDFVTKFVNMGAATGSSIFFSGRKCDKSKQKKKRHLAVPVGLVQI